MPNIINITEDKLRAAIQIALVGECEDIDRTESKLMHDINALSTESSKVLTENETTIEKILENQRIVSKLEAIVDDSIERINNPCSIFTMPERHLNRYNIKSEYSYDLIPLALGYYCEMKRLEDEEIKLSINK